MIDMFFQLIGSAIIGLAGLNTCYAIRTKNPLNAFIAGFVFAMGVIIISETLIP